jgi:hypothetical protein
LAWIASVADVLNGGAVAQEYEKDQTLFWLIRLMDLGFVIPAALITAAGLLRRARWGTRLCYAFIGFQTLLVAAIGAMAALMTARDDPAASPVLLVVTVGFTAALAVAFGGLLRTAARNKSSAVTGMVQTY